MNAQSLQDLYVNELRDLYSAENQFLSALPNMANAAQSQDLKQALQQQQQQGQGQVQRLQQIFNGLGQSPQGATCKGMQGLIQEGQNMITQGQLSKAQDAGLIAAAQKVDHYEIAGYGSARAWAQELGDNNAANLLGQSLDEVGQSDRQLSKLAVQTINAKAR